MINAYSAFFLFFLLYPVILPESVAPAKGPPLWRCGPFARLSIKNYCSNKCNISYGNNVPTILHQFLKLGTRSEACFAGPTGCPSIALPLDAAHSFGDTQSSSHFVFHPSPFPLLPVES